MKKIWFVIMTCALVFSMSGCGGNEEGSGKNTSETAPETGAEDTDAKEPGQLETEIGTAGKQESETGTAGKQESETGTTEEQKSETGMGQQEPEENMTEQDTTDLDGGAADGVADSATDGNMESGENAANGGALVVYFSWSGNTENVAKAIAAQTGADLYEIVPEEAYVDDYNTLLDIAGEEKESGARPAITGTIEDISQYEMIYVGYPNWWADMPMILYTFFDSYDLSGKTIAPFCTSGGSGLSGTVNRIRELEPDAEVLDGLHIGSNAASNPDQAVHDWLAGLGLAE